MRKGLLRLSLLGLALASACADDSATPTTPSTTIGGDGSRIHRSESGRLTPPSSAAVNEIVRDFLRGHVQGAADQMTVVSQTPSRGGISHVRLEQTIGGLRVYGAYVKAAITDQGELVQVIENLAPAAGLPRAAMLKHKDALAIAMKEHGFDFTTPAQTSANGQKLGFDKGTEFYRDPTVERVAYYEGNALKQGYLVETWSANNNQLDHTLIGGNGAIVAHELRTQQESYNVFAEDPGKTAQAVATGGPTPESPGGWLAGSQFTTNIRGNNVRAYLDRDNNNAPDAGGSSVSDGNFLAVADLAVSPTTAVNQAVAVQNLFYLNNVTHDLLHRHGFTPATGNFEGNDPVNAEAQDGGGTDNANFATPADGSSPRMQMYLWTGQAPTATIVVNGASYGAYQATFGPALTTAGVTGALALVNDGVGTASDGCEASAAGSLTGRVALVDRGTCDFTVKALNAQRAGAIAVVIANNVSGPITPGGTSRKVTVPTVGVSLEDGATLRGVLGQSTKVHKAPPPLQIDASLDSDIVYHEYGHGLTWRMIGSMSGAMSGAIGEGASDTLAFLINGDDAIAEYSFSFAGGIRRNTYANYPRTYSAFAGASVHDDGEIYAAAMWRLKELFNAAGRTDDELLGLWVDGMNFTPAGPKFEDMRDGILQASQDAATDCLIWTAFAEQGIGVGALATPRQGGRSYSITESFAVPSTCQ